MQAENESPGRAAPRTEYESRRAARRATAERAARADNRIANLRLGVFLFGAALAGILLYDSAVPAERAILGGASAGWLLVPAALFLALVVRHARVLERKARAEAAAEHYDFALARLDGRWAGKGTSGTDLAPEEHLYANDLDVFGPGSLFELLCIARTRSGEQTLARWLCMPAPVDEVRRRQEAVEDLRNRLDLREDIALYSRDVRRAVRPGSLEAWSRAPRTLRWPWLRPAAVVLSALTLTSLALLLTAGVAFPFLILLVVQLVFWRRVKPTVFEVGHGMQDPGRELNVLAQVLARLEAESFQAPLLRKVQAALKDEHGRASRRIAQLDRLGDLFEAQHNFLFAPVAFALLWGVHVGLAIENWRGRWGRRVPRWLEAVGEFEALSSLASYAYDHPEDPFPVFVEEGARFEGKGLGHPLLPEATCVRNDVRLGDDLRLMVVSGSNMSGKSTLLRTVGANAVLAQAGAPVRAASLTLSNLSIGATLHVQDSIQHGTSRFYAEIKRLGEMLEAARGPYPLLFLLDEILHGTNSHDRRVGAAATLRAFLETGAVGLITTHDLAVTQIVEGLNGRAVNVHFTDRLVDGRLVFDYTLRPGVVQEGNALRLMRSLGLPV